MGFMSGSKLKKCFKCNTPNPEKRGGYFYCVNKKCKAITPQYPNQTKINTIPRNLRFGISYDYNRKSWYYTDEFGTKCWIS